MNKAGNRTIGNHLADRTKAQALSRWEVGLDCAVSLWTNQNDLVRYEHTEGHAFSFYLEGGEGVSRQDKECGQGHKGAINIMPQGHSSCWDVGGRFYFLHVYLSDEELRRQFAHIFDKDARLLEMRDHTFVQSDALSVCFQNIQSAVCEGHPLAAEQAMTSLIYEAVNSGLLGDWVGPSLKAGLSPAKLNRVKDYMHEHLDQNISLKELAALVDLSPYHFQRNFKAQCGVSPHVWLTWARINRAKELLGHQEPVSRIADACAFSSQSHFTRTFKQYTGLTPGAYARIVAQ